METRPKIGIDGLRSTIHYLFLVVFLGISLKSLAAGPFPEGAEELIRQQQRERNQQQLQEKSPDVRLDSGAVPEALGRLPSGETPCFTIDRLILKGELAKKQNSGFSPISWSLFHAISCGKFLDCNSIFQCLASIRYICSRHMSRKLLNRRKKKDYVQVAE